MKKLKKVITDAKFRCGDSDGSLNLDGSARALSIGSKSVGGDASFGLVGKVAEQSSGRNILDYAVWMDMAYPHVIGIFGTRGTGKSFTLGVLAECLAGIPDIVSGKVPSTAAVIMDVQNQFWTMAFQPRDDRPEDSGQLADLSNWGLSPAASTAVALWSPCKADPHLKAAKVFRLSPGQLHEDDWLAILEQERYSPMGQALLFLLEKCPDHRPEELAKNASPQMLEKFQSGTVDGLRWRLQSVAKTGLICEPGVDILQLLQPGNISVMLLRNLNESMRALVVGVLSRVLAVRMADHHQARKVARRQGGDVPDGDMPERLWLALDEAHVIVPKEGETPASAPLVDYVKRGRDAGLSLVFATQQPDAVNDRLMSQVDLTFTHSLSFDADIQAAIKRMPTDSRVEYKRDGHKSLSLQSLIRSLEPGEAIVADAESGRIFIQKTRPRITAHGGNTPSSGV